MSLQYENDVILTNQRRRFCQRRVQSAPSASLLTLDSRPMDSCLDQTTLATISLLESRLLRLENILYGPTASNPPAQHESVASRMGDLERRFSLLLSRIRVYGDLVKICKLCHLFLRGFPAENVSPDKAHPDLFHAPAPSDPPSQLSADAIRSIVLASAAAYPAALSSLTAIKDCSLPETSQSTALISITERMRALQATQAAQAADMAKLRWRSEVVVRSWYQNSLLASSHSVADLECRVERVERQLRQRERARNKDAEM